MTGISKERERLTRIAKHIEEPGGSLAAATETRHVIRVLVEVEQMSDRLADVWTAVENDDEDKLRDVLGQYEPTTLPTANWLHGQHATPLLPQTLQNLRDLNAARPDMAVTALINEIDRLGFEVRRWRFNSDVASNHAKSTAAHAKRTSAADRATLGRLWRLVNRKRKTVPMDALRAAFEFDSEEAA